MNVYICGIGGVGGMFSLALTRLLTRKDSICLFDPDKYEGKNYGRQLAVMPGKPKTAGLGQVIASAFPVCSVIGIVAKIQEAIDCEFVTNFRPDVLICCADNQEARRYCFTEAKRRGLKFLSAANEAEQSEACYWEPGLPEPSEYLDWTTEPPPRTGHCEDEPEQTLAANILAGGLLIDLFTKWIIRPPDVKLKRYTPYFTRLSGRFLEKKCLED